MKKADVGGMNDFRAYKGELYGKSQKRSQKLPYFDAQKGEQLEIQIDSGEVLNFPTKFTKLLNKSTIY